MPRKKRRKSVPKDKKTGLPKKYLSGLKGSKRMRRARLIRKVSSIYRSGSRRVSIAAWSMGRVNKMIARGRSSTFDKDIVRRAIKRKRR